MSKEEDTIYIGRKPPMNYVLAVLTSFQSTESDEIVLKARGRAIVTAVDVAEITRRRFMEGLEVGDISIGTELLPQEHGGTRAVSTIEIMLTRSVATETEKSEGEAERARPSPSLELTAIKGIGEERAERLKACGVDSIQDLADSDLQKLSEQAKISEKTLKKWVEQAKKLITE